MSPEQASTWREFATEAPWLRAADSCLLGIAVVLRSRLASGEPVGVSALNLLRQCLGQMGMTPADASKVTLPGVEDDPDDQFFHRPS